MKELLKKTAALWIAAIIALTALWLPSRFRAAAADPEYACLTVELLPLVGLQQNDEVQPLGKGFLCAPAKIELSSGETAAQTLMRFLAEKGYGAYYTGDAKKDYRLGYISSGDRTEPHNGYVSSVKEYPVKKASQIAVTGALPPLAEAILGSYGIKWDSEKDRIDLNGFIGEKDLTKQSLWVFSLNNEYVTKPLSEITLAAGDTLRVQFSLAGGKDLGYSFLKDGTVKTNAADRSALIRLAAAYEDRQNGSAVYQEALAALGKMSLTEEEIARISAALSKELKDKGIEAPEPPETTTVPTTRPNEPPTEPTTKKPEPTTKKPEPTTKKPEPTTKKPEPTTKKPEPTTKKTETTTKKSETTTKKSTTTTRTVYTTRPTTTRAPATTSLLTTVVETTTIFRPEGIVLQHVSKEIPTTEEVTTAPEETEETTGENAGSLVEKLKTLRYSDGALRNIIIVCAIAVIAAVAVVVIRKKAKKTP